MHGDLSDELKRRARALGTPVNVEALIQSGVLVRHGQDTYRVHNPDDLPEHARIQMRAYGNAPDGALLVRFPKPSKRAQALARRLTQE